MALFLKNTRTLFGNVSLLHVITSLSKKAKVTSSQRSVEQENLEKKKAIIARLTAIDETTDADEASKEVRELMKEWNGIGHVPFKEKDRLYKQYHGLIDQLFDRFNISASNKKLSNFKSSIGNIQSGGSQSLYREREKLVRYIRKT